MIQSPDLSIRPLKPFDSFLILISILAICFRALSTFNFEHYPRFLSSDLLSSIGPVGAAPLLGFGDVPTAEPVSVIDFHGVDDDTIPFDLQHAEGEPMTLLLH